MSQKRRKMLVVQPYHSVAQYLFLILLGSIVPTHIHACTPSERISLMSLALTLSSPSLNWTTMDCCQWEGITCDVSSRVTHLRLSSEGLKLKGGIFSSSSLGNLTYLTHLNLSHNSLYGSLDLSGFFLSLSRLEVLDLSYNFLSGELPRSLSSSSSSNIRMVDLSSNRFHGSIPSSFFQQARSLISFNVNNNNFSGSLPSSICVHSSSLIRLLDFSFNKFGGNLSRGLGNCSKLEVFRAGYNHLSGSLPEDIYDATKLEEIAIPVNSFYGGVSDRIVNLTNLAILDLNFNNFSGILPINIGKLSKLKVLILHSNNLEGSLPPSLMNCTHLTEMHLGLNYFKGDISAFNFSRLGQLSKLDFFSNNFTGILPRSLYSCKLLRAIRLSLNNLEGQIHPEILSLKQLSFLSLSWSGLTNVTGAINILKSCKNLKVLILSRNFVGEEMPDGDRIADFDGFQNLWILALRGCQLTGQIPVWLSKLKKLEILDISLNRITGSIPTWLGTFPMLFFLDLRSNLISGGIPKELCRLPMLVSEQTATHVDHGYPELPFFAYARDVNYLQFNSLSYYEPSIFLGNNSISGNIPTAIGQLQALHKLDLNTNQITGNIPSQISNLKNLESLDLSRNHLSGKIPASVVRLSFLSSFNVSHNNLQGAIPKSTQLQGLNVSAFEGNPKLCGSPLPKLCQSFNGIDADDDENDRYVENGNQNLGLHISVVLGFIIGLVGVCGSLMLIKTWRDAYFQFLNNVQDRLKCSM